MRRSLSFRRRLIGLSTAAVALAIALAAGATYLIVAGQLRRGVDEALRAFAGDVTTVPPAGRLTRRPLRRPLDPVRAGRARTTAAPVLVLPSTALGGQAGYAQLVAADGAVQRPPGQRVDLPAGPAVRAVAQGRRAPFFYDARLGGEPVRVYVSRVGPARALQAAQSLSGVDGTLRRLALVLALVTAGGTAVAVGVGRLVARAAARPVRELTAGAEYVTRTQDLRRRVHAPGEDELSRLAAAFNAMLAALAESRQAQRRLVADASHELRTPLTTVLANVELLGREDGLPAGERAQMRRDLVSQLHELDHLVGDLVELAREGRPEAELEAFDLAEVVAECVERVSARAPGVRFVATLDHSPVVAARARVERAVVNLLDNAAKFSPRDGRVEVLVRDAEVVVRDEGPGIPPEDRPHVFDRFYRGEGSRSLPGSGLGLAIVRSVAEAHGGSAWAGEAPGGGAELHVSLAAARAPGS